MQAIHRMHVRMLPPRTGPMCAMTLNLLLYSGRSAHSAMASVQPCTGMKQVSRKPADQQAAGSKQAMFLNYEPLCSVA
jgi:hypothetical protein